jgi:predicted AAA+ superfamily ATPase
MMPYKQRNIGGKIRDQLLNYPNVGSGFEAFISEEIIKGVQATDTVNWNYYYFRTKNGAKIDLILEGPFGTLPIEIKLGTNEKEKKKKGTGEMII